MLKNNNLLKNEDGFILVVGMAIMVVLTLLGISAIRNTVIDLKIAGNEREIARKFYVADTAWQVGGLWLNHRATPPEVKNLTPQGTDTEVDITKKYYAVVRNYGDGGDAVTNDTFPDGTADGNFAGTPFWYRLIFKGDQNAEKFGEGYRDFKEEIQTTADGTIGIATRMYKVYKVGY